MGVTGFGSRCHYRRNGQDFFLASTGSAGSYEDAASMARGGQARFGLDGKLARVDRPLIEKTLTERHAEFTQRRMLRFGLDTFRNDFHAEVFGDGGNRLDQRGAAFVDLPHELAVDLHVIEREAAEQIEVAVLRAEVVDGEQHAARLQYIENGLRARLSCKQEALGDFENQRDAG